MVTTTCRSIRVALFALGCVCAGPVWALGLGDIEVDSALNERFAGQIELVDAGGLQSSEIIVSMASSEDFERVGVERFFYLTDLTFEVEVSAAGAVVNVSSSRPVSEPYLNFIVELHWPSGRLLKEYTVLLDPPTFGQAAAPAVSAPTQTVAESSAGRIQREPEPAVSEQGTRVTLAPRPAQRATPVRDRAPDGTIMTTRDDTLWKIAQRTVAADDISVNQQMLAIQRLNRQAFIKDNINLLKAGYVLRIPTESEARSLSVGEATQEVAQQNDAWRNPSAVPDAVAEAPAEQIADAQGAELRSQVDATAAPSAAPAEQTSGEPEVRIVASSGELAVGSGAGADEQVTQLIEEKDELTREVDELTYRLDRQQEISDNEVAMKDRQIEVKDQEIAALQQQLKEVQDNLSAAQQNQNQSPSGNEPPPAPWWASPMVLGAVIGVLVLVLVGLLVALRRNRGEEVAFDAEEDVYEDDYAAAEDEYDEDAGQVEPVIGGYDDEDDDEDLEADAEETFDETFAEDEVDEEAAEEAAEVAEDDDQSQTGDPIGEADIYIAYGRYGQAANLLLTTLNTEPDLYDVRLKLLEVYVETNDRDNFAQHAEYIVENCDDEDILMACRELEGRLGENELDFTASEDAAEATTEEEVQLDDSEGTVDDFSLDIEDLGDDADADDAAVGEGAADDEFQLEFDDEELDAGDTEAATNSDELGGDLGLDFDPDRDVADESGNEPEGSDEVAEIDAGEAADEIAAADQSSDEAEELPDIDFEESGSDAAEADEESAPSGQPTLTLASDSGETVQPAAGNEDDDFDFEGEDSDVNSTKLDLAEAYIDMGDADGARDILHEVVEEGSPEQQQKAQGMLDKMAS